jgi:SAM-dependent methyltransferase
LKQAINEFFRRLTLKNLLNEVRIIREHRAGVDFSSMTEWVELASKGETVHRSSPSGGKYLQHLLNDIDITSNDLIIDIGCGKGSAMRSMLKFPFARVDGIEFSEQIAKIAIRNLKKLNVKRSNIFICSAHLFQHYDRYNMYYFYNPFGAEIMSKVISNINQKIYRTNREILIIYNNPVCHDIIIEGSFFKISEYPAEWGNQIYIYSNKTIECSMLNC